MNKEQILYEDNDIIVCHKPAGIATQTAKVGQRDMVSEITNYLASHRQARPYVGLVHRLDQPVEGLLVFGKSRKAANELSRQIAENRMEKYYYAVVSGEGPAAGAESGGMLRGTLTDYLQKDSGSNTSRIVPPEGKGAKKAVLEYEVLNKKELYLEDFPEEPLNGEIPQFIALARVRLITGRHHQIRVQMSHAGMSLLGD